MIYTFYSFKGGVGRSMALAAVAYEFAQRGLKVLTIDFDLEAPGLERYFVTPHQAAQARAALGLVDLLTAYKAAMTNEAEFEAGRFRRWWDYVIEAVPSAKGGGYVDLMTAGSREPEERLQAYASTVRSFDWMDFFHNWHGEQFFVWLRQQLLGRGDEPDRGYDVVLVDSRTGLTEMGGVCAYQLADCAVMFCAANQQNIDGTLQVARDFQSDAVRALRRGRDLELLVLPARLEADNLRREEFLRSFEAAFPRSQFLPKALYEAGQDYRTLALPYVRELAVIEQLVGDDDRELGPSSAATEAMFSRLADALTLVAKSGRLAEQRFSAEQALAPSMAGFGARTVVSQIADPTRRSSGFDLLLDLSSLMGSKEVSAVQKALNDVGLSVWILDCDESLLDERWEESIHTRIAQSEAVAIYIGEKRAEVWSAQLLGWAREARKPILPLVGQDVPPDTRHFALTMLGLTQVRYLWLDPGRPDECAREIKVALGAMRRPAAPRSAPLVERNPYPGERSFTEDDAEFFFGRERGVADLLLLARAPRIVVVIGPAGVGKTSLLRAGLMPRLRAEARAPLLRYVDLAAANGAAQPPAVDSASEDGGRIVEAWLILDSVDSFPTDGDERAIAARIEVMDRWLTWAEDRSARVVVAMRDTLPAGQRRAAFSRWRLSMPGADEDDRTAVRSSTVFNLAPLPVAGLQAAIEKPAARLGHVLDPGLPQLLIDQACAAHSAIAQIARVLPRLWAERTRGWLTLRAHDTAGGVRGCFEASFQKWLAELDGERRAGAECLVRSLSHLDSGTQLASEPANWSPLATIPLLKRADALLLREQMAARGLIDLLRAPAKGVEAGTATSQPDGEVRVSLLFGTPKPYGPPFDKPHQPDFMLWRRRFASYVSSWESVGRAVTAVVAGPLLAEARRYFDVHRDELTEPERALIHASLAVEQEADAREHRLEAERLASEGLRRAKEQAERERDLAIAAQREAELQRTRASLAATGGFIAAYAASDPTASALAAVELLQTPDAPPSALWHRTRVLDSHLVRVELRGHQRPVGHASFSPDGQSVLTASSDNTARLWSRDGKLVAELSGHHGPVVHASFSPDGQTVLTASWDNTARLWSRDGKALAELRGHQRAVPHASISPDGQTVLTASWDDTARLWSRAGRVLAELRGHHGPVNRASFSPDGQTVLTASADGTGRLWSHEGATLAELRGHHGRVRDASFSPDGQTLLTASEDGTARLWSRKGTALAELRGHHGPVNRASFSLDGQTVLTASEDGTARLWSREGKALTVLRGHQRAVPHASFSPDGRTVLTASWDGTARLWDRDGKAQAELRGHHGPVLHASFSPDGKTVLTAASNDTAWLWNREGKALAELRGHHGPVFHASFSPDGRTVMTASADGTARLWSREGTTLAKLHGHHGRVVHGSFSPDGQTVLTASSDNTARLWSREGTALAELRGHHGPVNRASFSPDGHTVLTASSDNTARLWSRKGTALAELRGHHGPVNRASFSPDGQTVLTASEDGTARLWSHEGQALAELHGHHGAVFRASFSPDGQTVLTASADGTARLWSREGTALAELSAHDGPVLHANFSPNGQTVLTASWHGPARLWSREGTVLAELRGHHGPVVYASFSPDGQTVLTASGDGTARLWSHEGTTLAELRGHHGPVNRANFSPDGQTVLTASEDGTARLWPTGKEAFIARIRQIAKPCLTIDERRRFFVDESEETLTRRIEECEQALKK